MATGPPSKKEEPPERATVSVTVITNDGRDIVFGHRLDPRHGKRSCFLRYLNSAKSLQESFKPMVCVVDVPLEYNKKL
jgi:hypothetical protein